MLGLSGSRFRWHNAHKHAGTRTFKLELHCPGRFGKQGVILAHANIFTCMLLGTALTDKDIAGQYYLTAVAFHAEAFGLRVAAVSGTTACLLVSHCLLLNFLK